MWPAESSDRPPPRPRPPRAGREPLGSAAGMADVEPLRALHYDLDRTRGLQDVVAPPYDVIDDHQRGRSRGQLALQRRADRPAGRHRPLRQRGAPARGLARGGRDRPRRAAGAVAARAGLHRTRRAGAQANGVPRARARGGLRPRPDPPARAHASRVRRRTGCGSRARPRRTCRRSSRCSPTPTAPSRARSPHATAERPLGPGDRRRRHGQPPLAGRGPGDDRRGPRRHAGTSSC